MSKIRGQSFVSIKNDDKVNQPKTLSQIQSSSSVSPSVPVNNSNLQTCKLKIKF